MTNNTIEVHQAFIASILANDDHWKTLITEDIYFQGPLAEVQGEEDFRTLNAPFFEAIQDIKTHQTLVESNTIATQLTITIEQHNRHTISFPVAEWYTIQDGKIKHYHLYFDPRPLM